MKKMRSSALVSSFFWLVAIWHISCQSRNSLRSSQFSDLQRTAIVSCSQLKDEIDSLQSLQHWENFSVKLNGLNIVTQSKEIDAKCLFKSLNLTLQKLKESKTPFSEHRKLGKSIKLLEKKLYEQRGAEKQTNILSVENIERAIELRESLSLQEGTLFLIDTSVLQQNTLLFEKVVSHLHPEDFYEKQQNQDPEKVAQVVFEKLRFVFANKNVSNEVKKNLSSLVLQVFLNNSFWFTGYSHQVVHLVGPEERNAKVSYKSALPNIVQQLKVLACVEFQVYSNSEFDLVLNSLKNKLRSELIWNSVAVREADVWIKTSYGAHGPGDFLGGLTNIPGFTNHAGIIAFQEREGFPTYHSLELTLKFIQKPINLQQQILLRPNFLVSKGITARSVENMKRFPRVVFDSLFQWGIEPVGNLAYIYCTEMLHYMFASEMKKIPVGNSFSAIESKSVYSQAQIYPQWRNSQFEQNAEMLGFSNKIPALFSAPLLTSPSTSFVSGFFQLYAPKKSLQQAEKDLWLEQMTEKFEVDFLALLSQKQFKKPSAFTQKSAEFGLALLGLVNSSSTLRANFPEAIQEPMLMAESLNFPPGKEAMILKFFVAVQTSFAQMTGIANESVSSEQVWSAYDLKVRKNINNLFVQ